LAQAAREIQRASARLMQFAVMQPWAVGESSPGPGEVPIGAAIAALSMGRESGRHASAQRAVTGQFRFFRLLG
jgi:hypothetical protein